MTAAKRYGSLFILMPLAVLSAQCSGDTAEVVCVDDLSTTDAGRKVQAFVDTSNALIRAAAQIDNDMLNACRGMAQDLGIPASQLEPVVSKADDPGAGTEAACTRVKQEVDRILSENLVANAKMAIVYTPAVCTVDADAQLRCEQQCDPVTVTVTRLECKPGKAYGQCMANCMGTCTGSCMGGCTGTCAATCSGTCTGNCLGSCNGTCAAQNADGSCYGACTGTCTGTCDGTCTGSCSGACTGSCSASCTGTCEGDCSIWIQPPQCTEVQETTTVQECKTTCEAQARFEAVCTEPSLTVTYGYAGTVAQEAELDRLVAALANNYGRFLEASYRATVVVADAAAGYSVALSGITDTAKQVGLGASACIAQAISQVAGAVARVNVSVSVSVEVTASVSAMGGVAAN